MSPGDALHQQDPAAPLTPEEVEAWRMNIRQDTLANYHLEMAVALRREGSMAAAAEAFGQVLTITPDAPEARVGLIDALAAMGRNADAIDPGIEAVGCVRLGILDARDRRPGDARDRGHRALALKPGYPPAEVLLWLVGFLEKTPAPLPDSATALSTEMAGLAEEAGGLGMELTLKQRHDLAEPLLRFTLLHKENPEHLRRLASTCQARFALDDAARFLARAGALDPADVDVATSLVRTEVARGRVDTAAAALDAIAQRQPGNLSVMLHQCLLSLVLDRPADALKQGEAALGRYGERGSILSIQGLALVALGEVGRAEAMLRRALAAGSDEILCLLDVAIGLRLLGRSAEADEVQRRVAAHSRGRLAPFLAATRRWVGSEALRSFGVPPEVLPEAAPRV